MRAIPRSILEKLAAAGACGVLAVLFFVPLVPRFPKDELFKPTFWGGAVIAGFAGWGTLLARFAWPTTRASLPLRVVWGASAAAALGGLLASAGILASSVLYGIVGGGCLVLATTAVRERVSLAATLERAIAAGRRSPGITAAASFLGLAVLVHYVGGGADTTSNPYDDDVSYYPSAKQLLERGTLIDPFSFRRMSTLGGQAFFQALLLLRVPVLHLNLFDRGICFLIAALLLATQRVGNARVPVVARLVSVGVLVALPNTSINAASYYSGLAFFLALFQTLERMDGALLLDVKGAARRVLPLALTASATCTLRQNYQVSVALFVILSYGFAVIGTRAQGRLVERLIEPFFACLLTSLFVVPWLVLLYRSSGTFLFPIMKGNFRPGVEVSSQLNDFGSRLRFFVDVWLGAEPLRTLPLFFLIGMTVREGSARRPLVSFWLASFAGVALLAWSFSLSDPGNLARYSYGFATAAALSTWQAVTVNLARRTAPFDPTAAIQGGLSIFGLLYPVQLHTDGSRKTLFARIDDMAELWRRSVPMQVESPVELPYRRLQNAVPAGARLLVLLDRPYYLDYRRNEIWNLDMPGSASPPPGIPCFKGSVPVAEYFRAQGIRYVAFVESSRSTFLYRREIWLDHLWDRDEIWRTYAPYMVDVMDNLADLARSHRHVHDEAGMVLLDLEAAR